MLSFLFAEVMWQICKISRFLYQNLLGNLSCWSEISSILSFWEREPIYLLIYLCSQSVLEWRANRLEDRWHSVVPIVGWCCCWANGINGDTSRRRKLGSIDFVSVPGITSRIQLYLYARACMHALVCIVVLRHRRAPIVRDHTRAYIIRRLHIHSPTLQERRR